MMANGQLKTIREVYKKLLLFFCNFSFLNFWFLIILLTFFLFYAKTYTVKLKERKEMCDPRRFKFSNQELVNTHTNF